MELVNILACLTSGLGLVGASTKGSGAALLLSLFASTVLGALIFSSNETMCLFMVSRASADLAEFSATSLKMSFLKRLSSFERPSLNESARAPTASNWLTIFLLVSRTSSTLRFFTSFLTSKIVFSMFPILLSSRVVLTTSFASCFTVSSSTTLIFFVWSTMVESWSWIFPISVLLLSRLASRIFNFLMTSSEVLSLAVEISTNARSTLSTISFLSPTTSFSKALKLSTRTSFSVRERSRSSTLLSVWMAFLTTVLIMLGRAKVRNSM